MILDTVEVVNRMALEILLALHSFVVVDLEKVLRFAQASPRV